MCQVERWAFRFLGACQLRFQGDFYYHLTVNLAFIIQDITDGTSCSVNILAVAKCTAVGIQ